MQETPINIRLLIEGCLTGNRGSQRKLYEHFYGYGMSICLRYGKNKIEAEEIFNDAFLRIFYNLDKYDTAFPFKPWLRKILVNTAIDYHRKFLKHQVIISSDKAEFLANQQAVSPPASQEEEVLPIIQQLTPQYRIVFNLYVMEGYKHHEIAELLDISVGTSKSNLARAKNKLRTLWQEYYPQRAKN